MPPRRGDGAGGPAIGAARRRAGWAAAAGALLAACALAGCTSGGTTSSAAGSTSTRPPAPTTPTTGSSTTGGGTSTTGSGGRANCQPAQLRMSPQMGNGGAGTIELTINLTNTSPTTCVMAGYPGMQLLSSGGAPIPTNVVRGGVTFGVPAANQAPATVTLAPQRSAAFTMHYEDVPIGNETSCPTSAQAEITPPNDTGNSVVPLQIAPCGGGTVHVSPVYAIA